MYARLIETLGISPGFTEKLLFTVIVARPYDL